MSHNEKCASQVSHARVPARAAADTRPNTRGPPAAASRAHSGWAVNPLFASALTFLTPTLRGASQGVGAAHHWSLLLGSGAPKPSPPFPLRRTEGTMDGELEPVGHRRSGTAGCGGVPRAVAEAGHVSRCDPGFHCDASRTASGSAVTRAASGRGRQKSPIRRGAGRPLWGGLVIDGRSFRARPADVPPEEGAGLT